jgi:hypothetical protein
MRSVLLVVDDGPGTAELQRRLVAALPAMVAEAQSNELRMRIAVTTTTVAGPFCDSRAHARSGRFAMTSCLDRLTDFIAEDGTDDRDLCTSMCTKTTAELAVDQGRPWIAIEDSTDPVDVAQRLACLVPQGTSGCPRPAPFGALGLALLRAENSEEEEHGFFRYHSWRHALFVTDGMDCTVTDAGQAAFDPAGARTLWPDPNAEIAPLAACWNAGVACEGEPPIYDDCEQADVGVDGAPTSADASVLASYHPLAWSHVDIEVIAGVPEEGDVVYTTQGDPAFVAEHGIAPGCDDGVIRAMPPLRLDAYALPLHSACATTYDAALERTAYSERHTICLPSCDAARVKVLPSADTSTPEVARCDGDSLTPTIPEGASSCHLWIPDSPHCSQHRTELVVRTREIGNAGSVWLSPNPFARSTPACGS